MLLEAFLGGGRFLRSEQLVGEVWKFWRSACFTLIMYVSGPRIIVDGNVRNVLSGRRLRVSFDNVKSLGLLQEFCHCTQGSKPFFPSFSPRSTHSTLILAPLFTNNLAPTIPYSKQSAPRRVYVFLHVKDGTCSSRPCPLPTINTSLYFHLTLFLSETQRLSAISHD